MSLKGLSVAIGRSGNQGGLHLHRVLAQVGTKAFSWGQDRRGRHATGKGLGEGRWGVDFDQCLFN